MSDEDRARCAAGWDRATENLGCYAFLIVLVLAAAIPGSKCAKEGNFVEECVEACEASDQVLKRATPTECECQEKP